MLLPGENSPKTWLFLTILVSTIIAFSESTGGKKIDIKLGFDLTQGSNGSPSLRIRDFEGSAEYNPRAVPDVSSSDSSSSSIIKEKNGPPTYSSESEAKQAKKDISSKEPAKSSKNSGTDEDVDDKSSDSGDDDKLRITRGLKVIDFDAEEESPKVHGRYQKNSESDKTSDESRRRYKRHIGRFGYRKGKISV